jgi:hypothetical protein
MQVQSTLHQAARAYAERGIPVFPCWPNSKQPATEHGFHEATTNLTQIDAWWEAEPNYNIAFQPDAVGLATVDLDGETGLASWAELEAEHGKSPDTWTVDSPRGGRHLHFRGQTRPSVAKLAPKVDTRGGGSYALLPPSVFAGKPYQLASDAEPAPLPAWINEALDSQRKPVSKSSGVPLDIPSNIEYCRRYLSRCVRDGRVAVEGQSGDEVTYTTACDLRDMGLSEPMALDLMTELWNPHCKPPWDGGELAVKVANAYTYAQNEPGAFATPSPADTFGPALDKLGLTEPARETSFKRPRFQPLTFEELAQLPPPSWLVPDLIPAKRISLWYGDQGSYKSFMALGQCLELATLGIPTVYVAGEGARELETRKQAWALLNGVEGPLSCWVVGDMPQAAEPAQVVELIDAIGEAGIRPQLVVIDTVFRAMLGLNENAAEDMGKMVAAAEAIQKAFGCAVMLIHHKGNSGEGPRGSSALLAAVDAAVEVRNDKETKAVALWVRRMKDAAERATPFTYQGQELGPSLAFRAIDYDEYRAITGEAVVGFKDVAAVLVAAKAYGEENGLTTDVLAFELLKDAPLSDPVASERAHKKMVRLLVSGSRTTLGGYAYGEDGNRLWYLPATGEP